MLKKSEENLKNYKDEVINTIKKWMILKEKKNIYFYLVINVFL